LIHTPASDEAAREALRLNDEHVRGLTRLDQQLVYFPVIAIAATVHEVLNTPISIDLARYATITPIFLFGVPTLIVLGLIRNHLRHAELLVDRERLRAELHLPAETRRLPLWTGRAIYLGLFAIGWSVGAAVLFASI
jgi:hypothetical protein